MFENIREQKKGVLTYILVGLAGLGMVFLGVPLFNHSAGTQDIASVNGQGLGVNALNEQLSALQRQFPNLDRQLLQQQALQQLINQAVLEQHALNGEYHYSKPALYQNIKNQFGDEQAYQAALKQMRTNAPGYEAAVAQQQTVQQYYQFLNDSEFDDKILFNHLLKASAQTRDYSVVRLSLTDAKADIALDADAVQTYFNDHREDYQTAEKISLNYLVLDAATLNTQADIDEQAITDALAQASKASAKRSGRYLIFDDAQIAQDSANALSSGAKSFDELYRAISDGDISGEAGELPLQTHGEGPSPIVDDALFALETSGAVSPLLSTDYGNMLVSVNEIQSDTGPNREEVIQSLTRQANEAHYLDIAARAFDAALGGKPFSQIVDITGVSASTLDDLTPNQAATDWLSNPALQQQLFGANALAVNSVGEPIELDNQRSVFFQVSARELPQNKPFSEVAASVEQDYQTQQAQAILNQQSEQLAEVWQQNEAIDALVTTFNASVQPYTGVSTNSDHAELSPEAVATLFNQQGRIASTDAANGDKLITRLEAVHEGEVVDLPPELAEAFFKQWQQSAQLETLANISQWLHQQAKITIYEDRLPNSQ